MKCPDCQIEMNCHALKVIQYDPGAPGLQEEEFVSCPECGKTYSQKIPPEAS